jgi:hypothetical protein
MAENMSKWWGKVVKWSKNGGENGRKMSGNEAKWAKTEQFWRKNEWAWAKTEHIWRKMSKIDEKWMEMGEKWAKTEQIWRKMSNFDEKCLNIPQNALKQPIMLQKRWKKVSKSVKNPKNHHKNHQKWPQNTHNPLGMDVRQCRKQAQRNLARERLRAPAIVKVDNVKGIAAGGVPNTGN